MLRVTPPPAVPVTIIEARPIGFGQGLQALWQYRELIAMLAIRDAKLRYQHTTVGAAWALLQPLAIMLVLTGFASVAGIRTGMIPYPLYVISGLVPWTYFTHVFTTTTYSLSSQSTIIQKIYFPRLVIPVATALAGSIDFCVAAVLLPIFMVVYGHLPTLALLAIPAFVVMALAAAFAMGLWLTVLNIRYHDVGNALPFFIQLMFFTTPIAYSAQAVPDRWRMIIALNPMVGVVDGFRWSLLGGAIAPLHASIWVSLASTLLLLLGGVAYFLRREPAFADEI